MGGGAAGIRVQTIIIQSQRPGKLLGWCGCPVSSWIRQTVKGCKTVKQEPVKSNKPVKPNEEKFG